VAVANAGVPDYRDAPSCAAFDRVHSATPELLQSEQSSLDAGYWGRTERCALRRGLAPATAMAILPSAQRRPWRMKRWRQDRRGDRQDRRHTAKDGVFIIARQLAGRGEGESDRVEWLASCRRANRRGMANQRRTLAQIVAARFNADRGIPGVTKEDVLETAQADSHLQRFES